jgi:hypothetical protein
MKSFGFRLLWALAECAQAASLAHAGNYMAARLLETGRPLPPS